MIGLPFVYILAGLAFLAFAVLSLRDRTNPKRWGNGAFWGLLALSMLAGDRLGDLANGLLVLALVAIAGTGQLGRSNGGTTPEIRAARAARYGNRLFLLALVIPATALAGTFGFEHLPGLVNPKQVTLVSLALGAVLALLVGLAWLRPHPAAPLQEGRRLMDSVGWAAILPQMLASLGAVFALAGVGDVVGGLMSGIIPEGSRGGAIIAFTLGMALFTMITGNAFAAFPVISIGIGIPVLVGQHGADPLDGHREVVADGCFDGADEPGRATGAGGQPRSSSAGGSHASPQPGHGQGVVGDQRGTGGTGQPRGVHRARRGACADQWSRRPGGCPGGCGPGQPGRGWFRPGAGDGSGCGGCDPKQLGRDEQCAQQRSGQRVSS